MLVTEKSVKFNNTIKFIIPIKTQTTSEDNIKEKNISIRDIGDIK